jgi:hypothetical protein
MFLYVFGYDYDDACYLYVGDDCLFVCLFVCLCIYCNDDNDAFTSMMKKILLLFLLLFVPVGIIKYLVLDMIAVF